jgi:hypothetical protein
MDNKFHTRANLSQALVSIINQHYTSVNATKEHSQQMPAFMAQAIQLICYELAGVVNDNLYDYTRWVNISNHSNEITNILKEALKAANDQEGS